MEVLNTVAWKGAVGRLRQEQIARISTWARVPDSDVATSAMTQISVVPMNASTLTYVNPLDQGDGPDRNWYDAEDKGWGTCIPASRGRY